MLKIFHIIRNAASQLKHYATVLWGVVVFASLRGLVVSAGAEVEINFNFKLFLCAKPRGGIDCRHDHPLRSVIRFVHLVGLHVTSMTGSAAWRGRAHMVSSRRVNSSWLTDYRQHGNY